MNFTNVWKTSTPETRSVSQLQEQNIPLFGIVRTMNRRRPEPIKMPRRHQPTDPNDDDDNGHHQIPLPYHGPGNFTSHVLAPPSSPIVTFLDSTFRTYTERIHTELTNLRTVCTKVIFREQQERERWKAHCVAFRQERDIARERVKVLIGEGGGRMVVDDASARRSLRELRRSRSYGPLPAAAAAAAAVGRQRSSLKGSRSASPPTTHSRKVASDTLGVPPAAFPRSSAQSSRSASPALSSSATAFSELDNDTTLYDLAYPSPKLTPLDRIAPPSLFLFSNVDAPLLKRSHSAGPILAHPPTSLNATENAEPLFLPSRCVDIHHKRRPLSLGSVPRSPETTTTTDAPTKEHTLSPHPSWVPTRDALLNRIPVARKATLQLEHVDLMYRSVDELLECRACRLARDKLDNTDSGSGSGLGSGSSALVRVTSFQANASWEDLLEHCLMTHPTESRDVAGLHPAQIFELRRRLREKDSAAVAA